jgi:DNA polymerase-3 subunit alpha
MNKYTFPCGCEFDIVGENNAIKFTPEVTHIPLDCTRTWDLISAGNTKGCFQLESQLGQSLARKLKPRNINHLAALVSIMRPGVLEAVRNKKSVTQHYIDRKNGEEDVDYFHPALQNSLENTYGEMIYQEQAMRIARDIAGFTEQEADELRKAIGKKKTDLMAKMKIKFLDGAKAKNIVTEEEADKISSWIEKSQRYSFNKSHAVSYAFNAYLSAYAKAHFPRSFFTAYLYHAKNKAKPFDEIHALVQNARIMGVNVLGPDFRYGNKHFKLEADKNIHFGFFDIKGIGESAYKKMIAHRDIIVAKLKKDVGDWNWIDFLIFYSSKIASPTITAIINSGAISYMNISRTRMMYEYNIYQKLTIREQGWIANTYTIRGTKNVELTDIFKAMTTLPSKAACANEKRKETVSSLLKTLINPSYHLEDSPAWIASIEESLFGVPITCTSLESCDSSAANCTCIDYAQNREPKVVILAAKIDGVNEIKTKTGKTPGQQMAFLRVSDITGSLDNIVIFPEQWKEAKKIVFLGNNLLLSGQRSTDKASLIIKQCWQI